MYTYISIYIYIVGGVRFSCQCSPVALLPRGWRWLSLQHSESCLDRPSYILDTSGCLKCSVSLPRSRCRDPVSRQSSPPVRGCYSLLLSLFLFAPIPRVLTHSALLFLFLFIVCIQNRQKLLKNHRRYSEIDFIQPFHSLISLYDLF